MGFAVEALELECTSLFHSKGNVGATHEKQRKNKNKSTCIKDSHLSLSLREPVWPSGKAVGW